MDRRFEHFLHVFTRFNPDGFDLGPFVANNHLLLPFTLNENQTIDVITTAFVRDETFDLHGHGVRQFSAEETHQFFADDFRRHKTL
ncbi:Uncharacterised protein [Shigella sonnei]|nr:Uncharacterised protein [Shigella sonnei]